MSQCRSVQVRFATLLDQDVVSQYNYVARLGGSERVRQMIERQHVIIAEQKNQPAGYAFIDHLNVLTPFLAMIWVFESYRQQGVSRALLLFVEDHFRKQAHTVLYSSSQASELEAQGWHWHMGFQQCGFIAGEEPASSGEVFFRKRL